MRHCPQTLAVRLEVMRLSRRYFAVSLLSWKDHDAQRVAAQVVQPYARAYAMRLAALSQNDERVAEMVQGQLGQYRCVSALGWRGGVGVCLSIFVCCARFFCRTMTCSRRGGTPGAAVGCTLFL